MGTLTSSGLVRWIHKIWFEEKAVEVEKVKELISASQWSRVQALLNDKELMEIEASVETVSIGMNTRRRHQWEKKSEKIVQMEAVEESPAMHWLCEVGLRARRTNDSWVWTVRGVKRWDQEYESIKIQHQEWIESSKRWRRLR